MFYGAGAAGGRLNQSRDVQLALHARCGGRFATRGRSAFAAGAGRRTQLRSTFGRDRFDARRRRPGVIPGIAFDLAAGWSTLDIGRLEID